MNIEEAVNRASQEPSPREVLNVVGNIETDSSGKIRVYPDPHDLSRYVLIDPEHIDGEVLDVTEHAQSASPSRRGPVFSLPVRKGGEIQIVWVKTIPITDVAKMRFLSLDQSGGCGGGGCGCGGGCGGEGEGGGGQRQSGGCQAGNCTTVGGESYPCSEDWGGASLCSACCVAVTRQ